jgi:hypothetical protein
MSYYKTIRNLVSFTITDYNISRKNNVTTKENKKFTKEVIKNLSPKS